MSEPAVSPELREAVLRRRGSLTLFPTLDPSRTALVVIDMQNAFCAPKAAVEIPTARDIVPNINRLATACRQRGAPVIWVRMHCEETDKGWGVWRQHFLGSEGEKLLTQLKPGADMADLYPALDVRPGDLHVAKRRFSALIPGSSDLQEVLTRLDADTLLIVGTRTSICCESTARDAMMLNYKVLMVSDATADLPQSTHQAALDTVFWAFGDVVDTDEAIRRLG